MDFALTLFADLLGLVWWRLREHRWLATGDVEFEGDELMMRLRCERCGDEDLVPMGEEGAFSEVYRRRGCRPLRSCERRRNDVSRETSDVPRRETPR